VLFKPSALGAGEHTAGLIYQWTSMDCSISLLQMNPTYFPYVLPLLTHTHPQFRVHVFNLNGRGLPPTAMDPITVTASLSSNTVHILTFTNPLDTPSHYSISLQGADLEHFCLLMKRTPASPGCSLDIPVMFAPESMCRSARGETLLPIWCTKGLLLCQGEA